MEFLTTPEGFLEPLAAAVVAELLSLWLERLLPDWRYLPFLTLALSIGAEAFAAFAAGMAFTRAVAFRVIWLGFLGASVAVFGREAIFDLFGLLGQGPRESTRMRTLLGQGRWR
jgi:hypothetical protein